MSNEKLKVSEMAHGKKIAAPIFEAGFGSLSRFYDQSAALGMTPGEYRSRRRGLCISFACRHTHLGWLCTAATTRGVCFVQFGERAADLEQALRQEFCNARIEPSQAGQERELDRWLAALQHHIDAHGPQPDLPVHVFGTALQIRTWRFLAGLDAGETISYGKLAAQIGAPKAARAVANACAANRIALLIPCHRVLRADGRLGGYRWGLERKKALLAGESRQAGAEA